MTVETFIDPQGKCDGCQKETLVAYIKELDRWLCTQCLEPLVDILDNQATV